MLFLINGLRFIRQFAKAALIQKPALIQKWPGCFKIGGRARAGSGRWASRGRGQTQIAAFVKEVGVVVE